MINLNTCTFKAFNLISDDCLYIDDTVTNIKTTSNKTTIGQEDLVGATSKNNGSVGFIDVSNQKYITNGNCIVLIKTGQGSVGEAIYKANRFVASNNVYIARMNGLNRAIGNFLVAAINKQADRYSYGYIRNDGRLKQEKIWLPVGKDDKPDYKLIEQYMDELEKSKAKIYTEYCTAAITKIGKIKKIKSLNEIQWDAFFINDIFDEPMRGKRIVDKNHIQGNTPLVSSYGQFNGVTHFIGNTDSVRKFSNCLSIANGGSSAGLSFYHPYTFIAADHVTQCWNKKLNKYHYLFLSTVITKALMGKYGFSHEISDPRIAREKIMLPITPAGEPDFNYMEQYIKNMMIQKYKEYLDYKKISIDEPSN